MSRYIGSEVLIDDLSGDIKTIDDHVEINTSSIHRYMKDGGYHFVGFYDDGLVYTKANANQNTYRRVFLQEMED